MQVLCQGVITTETFALPRLGSHALTLAIREEWIPNVAIHVKLVGQEAPPPSLLSSR